MSRQYFLVETTDPDRAEYWRGPGARELAIALGVSERQIIAVHGAHVHAIEVQDPGEGKK